MPRPLLLLLALLVPAPAHAGVRIDLPGLVRAGDWVDLGWRDLPPEVREVELEISLSGGRWARISPEIVAAEASYRWQVPAGLAADAQVRLRAGGEGFERVLATSRVFAIACDAAILHARAFELDDWLHANGPGFEAPGVDARAPAFHALGEPLPAEPAPRAPHAVAGVIEARDAPSTADSPIEIRVQIPPPLVPLAPMRL